MVYRRPNVARVRVLDVVDAQNPVLVGSLINHVFSTYTVEIVEIYSYNFRHGQRYFEIGETTRFKQVKRVEDQSRVRVFLVDPISRDFAGFVPFIRIPINIGAELIVFLGESISYQVSIPPGIHPIQGVYRYIPPAHRGNCEDWPFPPANPYNNLILTPQDLYNIRNMSTPEYPQYTPSECVPESNYMELPFSLVNPYTSLPLTPQDLYNIRNMDNP